MLRSLRLSCNFSWQEALEVSLEYILPQLEFLAFVFDQHTRAGTTQHFDDKTIKTLSETIFSLTPEAIEFSIEGGNGVDDSVAAAVYKLYHGRPGIKL
jgi:hypothetical protein